MNFKFLIVFLFSLMLLGCGVKAKPLQPSETAIQSYIESYFLSDDSKETTDQNQKKK